jgi:lysophospholipase L1-like esterase
MRSYFFSVLILGLGGLSACRNGVSAGDTTVTGDSAASGQPIRYDTIRYARAHYSERVNLFNSEAATKGGIIFLGNSITEFGDWKTLLGDSNVINRGIAADNTFGVLDRLDDVIGRRPDKLFVEIGINDIAQNMPVPIIVNNILSIVAKVQAKSPGTKIYVNSVLPTNENARAEYPEVYGKNAQVNTVDGQLEQQAKGKSFTYIDLKAELRDKNGQLNPVYADPDGLHLNKAGYAVWVTFLREKKCL